MNRSRLNRRRLAMMRYEVTACRAAGGIEHCRGLWAVHRIIHRDSFYRNGASMPTGWQPRVMHCSHERCH